jgi:hypothetical protein
VSFFFAKQPFFQNSFIGEVPFSAPTKGWGEVKLKKVASLS